ncbi:MAG: AmmeMemoRadiSam system radical SAM enzyme, partial [Bacteroidales bacterium]|nr:AmmeMemoRadiSam system radical SAM enzyme [Bacteroidales bacterium]
LCPHNCTLKDREVGLCRTRVNIKGKLYTLAYANPCAVNVDPIEKKPLYHFLPSSTVFSIATGGCNFTCKNCQNFSISQSDPQIVRHVTMNPEEVVQACLRSNCKILAYTYTEPTVFYEYMLDIASLAKENGIRNVLVSNGYINPGPLKKLIPLLDAANIDLKAFDEDLYKNLCGGSLKHVLNTLKILKQKKIWLEITHLVIPSYSRPDSIERMCYWLSNNDFSDCPLHFSRFFPIYRLSTLPSTPLDLLLQAKEIAHHAGIKYVYLGNMRESVYSHTYCPNCKKLLIERMGYIISNVDLSGGKCSNCQTIIPGVWS